MSNDLNDKIKEIGTMFGINDMPENIGEIVESLISNNDSKSSESIENVDDVDKKDEKYVQIMNMIKNRKNPKNDKKIKLLYAIEPFLNDKRKSKIDNCIKFLSFADIAKEMNLF